MKQHDFNTRILECLIRLMHAPSDAEYMDIANELILIQSELEQGVCDDAKVGRENMG